MRVFIGVEFDYKVKDYLNGVKEMIKENVKSGDFTNYDNYHLTLRYIGNIYDDEQEVLEEVLDEVSKKIKAFDIKVGDIGTFGKGNTSIVWVGITKGKKELTSMYGVLEEELYFNGFDKEERKYNPHITIGKKVHLNGHGGGYLEPYNDIIKVQTITLFHSHRVNGVLTYTPIYRKDLL
jgi:2'-5' RNA ligase